MTEDFITEFRGGASAPPLLHVTGVSLMTYARLSALPFNMSQAYRREYGK